MTERAKVKIDGAAGALKVGRSVVDRFRVTVDPPAFLPMCSALKDEELAAQVRRQMEELQSALEQHAWDGDWYLCAFYDDGTPLGSAQNLECRIDAIAQSWAVLSGAAQEERARRAMAAVEKELVSEDEQLVLLFTPPLDKTARDPGYIEGYPPGIRENEGQYTHGAMGELSDDVAPRYRRLPHPGRQSVRCQSGRSTGYAGRRTACRKEDSAAR